jgi:hypothetical protein
VEVFESGKRTNGDLAGVFEYDGHVGYFYLYIAGDTAASRILDAIHVVSANACIRQRDVVVKWDAREERVGLFLQGTLWAVFNVPAGTKYGGNFGSLSPPDIPPEERFPS